MTMRHKKGLPISSARLETNIIAWYRKASIEHRVQGMLWYAQANEFAQALGSTYDTPVSLVAAVIAALSPGANWEQNKVDTVNLLDAHIHGRDCVVTTYGPNKVKAFQLASKTFNPLEVLGKRGRKVRAFWQLIADPLSDVVCIDRHAVRAATGKDLEWCHKRLGRVGVYDKIQQAYRNAAYALGVRPHQCQAVVWLAYKENAT
jgi:hypothetical protein